MHGATIKIIQSYGLCAFALLLALTRRYGVEPRVSAEVFLLTDCSVTMEVASETSGFYTLWRRLIELEKLAATSSTCCYIEWRQYDRTRLNCSCVT